MMTGTPKLHLRDIFWGAVAGVSTAVAVPASLISLSFHTPGITIGDTGIDLVAPFAAAAIGIPAGIAMGVVAFRDAATGSACRRAAKQSGEAPPSAPAAPDAPAAAESKCPYKAMFGG